MEYPGLIAQKCHMDMKTDRRVGNIDLRRLQAFITDGDGEKTATELMWSAKWPYTADGLEWRLAELATLLFVDAPLP